MEKKKIKVLRIINRFNLGGPTYNATFLSKFLSDDFETLLVGGLHEADEIDSLHITAKYGVTPRFIKSLKRTPNPIDDYKAYKEIKKIIKEFKPDIVHTHAAKAGAVGRKAAFSCKVPVVVHTFHGHVFHSYFSAWKTKLYKGIERRLAKKSSGIIAISDQQKVELSEIHTICTPEKIKVIPLGFDLAPFFENKAEKRVEVRQQYDLQDDVVAIAIIGRLVPIKDHAFFLSVVGKVASKTQQKIRFYIVGDGSEREKIASEVEVLNAVFGEIIVMTSWITDIYRFNAGMDIICLTSKNEGTPVSLIEAQASGVPIITTDVGGVKDIVLDGETGYIVEKNNMDLFAEKMLDLIENKKNREKMSQNGWTHVREKYHYDRLVKDMEEYYKELLKNNTI
ncbi:MAG: glycosyltransferase [Bacteroidota bacterium]